MKVLLQQRIDGLVSVIAEEGQQKGKVVDVVFTEDEALSNPEYEIKRISERYTELELLYIATADAVAGMDSNDPNWWPMVSKLHFIAAKIYTRRTNEQKMRTGETENKLNYKQAMAINPVY